MVFQPPHQIRFVTDPPPLSASLFPSACCMTVEKVVQRVWRGMQGWQRGLHRSSAVYRSSGLLFLNSLVIYFFICYGWKQGWAASANRTCIPAMKFALQG